MTVTHQHQATQVSTQLSHEASALVRLLTDCVRTLHEGYQHEGLIRPDLTLTL